MPASSSFRPRPSVLCSPDESALTLPTFINKCWELIHAPRPCRGCACSWMSQDTQLSKREEDNSASSAFQIYIKKSFKSSGLLSALFLIDSVLHCLPPKSCGHVGQLAVHLPNLFLSSLIFWPSAFTESWWGLLKLGLTDPGALCSCSGGCHAPQRKFPYTLTSTH